MNRIDWSQYADGAVWLLKRDEHFHGPATNAEATFRQWCNRRGLSSHVDVVDSRNIRIRVGQPLNRKEPRGL